MKEHTSEEKSEVKLKRLQWMTPKVECLDIFKDTNGKGLIFPSEVTFSGGAAPS